MDNDSRLFEWKGYSLGLASFFIFLLMFFNFSTEFFYSLFVAVLASVLVWGTYIVIRMIVLTARDKR